MIVVDSSLQVGPCVARFQKPQTAFLLLHRSETPFIDQKEIPKLPTRSSPAVQGLHSFKGVPHTSLGVAINIGDPQNWQSPVLPLLKPHKRGHPAGLGVTTHKPFEAK